MGKLSVRNGEAGRPAPLNRFGSEVSVQPKRTATGLGTSAMVTTTVSPSIVAVAGNELLVLAGDREVLDAACCHSSFSPAACLNLRRILLSSIAIDS